MLKNKSQDDSTAMKISVGKKSQTEGGAGIGSLGES